MSREVVKVGQMEIRYLVDGTQGGGLGLFEMKVPAGANVPRRTAIPTTRSAFMCWRACSDIRSMRKPAT